MFQTLLLCRSSGTGEILMHSNRPALRTTSIVATPLKTLHRIPMLPSAALLGVRPRCLLPITVHRPPQPNPRLLSQRPRQRRSHVALAATPVPSLVTSALVALGTAGEIPSATTAFGSHLRWEIGRAHVS